MGRPQSTQPDSYPRIARVPCRVLAVLLLALACAPAAAQTTVEGNLSAASFQFHQEQPVEADAYLLGFRQNISDESPYAWSFMAEEVEVAFTTKHYVAYQEVENRTEHSTHQNANGVLLERYPLAYLMTTSNSPDKPEKTFGFSFDSPPETFESRTEFNFDVEVDTEYPVFGGVFDESNPGSTQPFVSYQQPWPNLARKLQSFQGIIHLDGDFIFYVYDIVFRIDDGNTSTVYNATYGGWRDTDPVTGPLPPSPEWDVRYAQLTFTNASLQFLPAGRPLELNLQSASMDLSGDLILREARGRIQDAKGTQSLEGSIVSLDVDDAIVDVRPDADSSGLPGVELALTGQVHSVAVDGRPVPLDRPAEGSPVEEVSESTVTVPLAPSGEGDTSWWLLWLAVVPLGLGAWWLGRDRQARHNPEFLLHRSERALDEGRFTRALALLRRVLRHHPGHADAIARLAMLRMHRKEFSEARSILEPHLDGPADEHGLLSILFGTALQRSKQEKDARRFLQEAVRKHPEIRSLIKDYPELEAMLPEGSAPAANPGLI